MAVFVEGVAGILVFYVLVLMVGIWAGRRFKGDSELETMNAGRRLGWIVGTITLVGTWVGGGYINGSAEKMYTDGLVNVQVPVGYALALFVGARMFIRRMRDGNYITMVDIFQDRFGKWYVSLIIIPALLSEFFWCAAVLNSLGNTLEVVLEIHSIPSVVVSSMFAGLYTVVGGLNSVTYTDVAQIALIVVGMLSSASFAFHSEYVEQRTLSTAEWTGHVATKEIPMFIEDYFVLILGGIPWQGYFQRVFSIRSTKMALTMSWFSMVGCLLMAVPALVIGSIAKLTDWAATPFNQAIPEGRESLVLPLVLRYLTPPWVAFLGLGAVTGAVMSSSDSAILASAALITRNIYKHLYRPEASDRELHMVLRTSIVAVTVVACITALTVSSVYYLSFMCSDLVYVILFPQLVVALYMADANAYGGSVSFIFGFLMRILGEPNLHIPTVVRFPNYDEQEQLQRFPFRSAIMLTSGLLFYLVSKLTKYMFVNKKLSLRYDFLNAFLPKDNPYDLKSPGRSEEHSPKKSVI